MAALSRRSVLWCLGSGVALGGIVTLGGPSLPLLAQDYQVVATLAQLRTLLPGNRPAATVQEPGRGGNFVWNGADCSRQVGVDRLQGIYVAPAHDTSGASGAWVRAENQPINIMWFGAKGLNDCLAAFNAAMAIARFLGGGTIVFPYQGLGGWKLSDTAVIDADNVTIELHDDVAMTSTRPCSTFRFNRAGDVRLNTVKLVCPGRKCTIDGNGAKMTGYSYDRYATIYPAVDFRHCKGVVAENVHVTNGLVNSLLVRFCSDIALTDCDGSHTVYDNGISVNFALDYSGYDANDPATWTNARLLRCRGFNNNAVGIANYGGYGHTWTDCEAWGNGQDTNDQLPWGGGMTVEINGSNVRDSQTTIINAKCFNNRNYDFLASTFGVKLINPDFRGVIAPQKRRDPTQSYGSNMILFGRAGVKVTGGVLADAGRNGVQLLGTGPGKYPSLDFDGVISNAAEYAIRGKGIARVVVSQKSQINKVGKSGIFLNNPNMLYNKGGGVAILDPATISGCGEFAISSDNVGNASSHGVAVTNCLRNAAAPSAIRIRDGSWLPFGN